VTLSWTEVKGATSYDVLVSRQPNIRVGAGREGTKVFQSDRPTLTVSGFIHGRTYYCAVVAKNDRGDQSGPSKEVSFAIWLDVVEPASGMLNDTGVTWCANSDTNRLACREEGNMTGSGEEGGTLTHKGQDGEYGRDIAAVSKAGSGRAGFDFVKLDAEGRVLPDQSIPWADEGQWHCVKDNVTKLIWEVKTGAVLHAKEDLFTWYLDDPALNGGDAGSANGSGDCSTLGEDGGVTACNTQAYVERVNKDGWCGFDDWRLPTVAELQSILDYGSSDPAIDTAIFVNISVNANYWTATPSVRDKAQAMTVNIASGVVEPRPKASLGHVLLVRGANE